MAATPNYSFPYPVVSDSPNGPTQIQALATAVDTQLAVTDAAATSLAARTTALEAHGFLVARKTADESLATSTTLQNDDHLFLSVAANAVYALDAYVVYHGALSPLGDLKAAFTVPAGATLLWSSFAVNSNPPLTTYDVVVLGAAASRSWGTNAAGNLMGMQPKGVLTTSSTAGTLQLQWAQNASDSTPTVLKAGSYLRLTRIG